MAVSQKTRDSYPPEYFAVPAKRELLIEDATHVKLAWDMVDRTKDLTPEERAEARRRILHRAKELGIDTKSWTVHAIGWQLSAMSLDVPATPGHPNKMPFSGILTRIDEASDQPPEGSGGHRVLIPKAVAEQALPSLLGMALDFKPNLDGHDNQNKIGVITEARIEGNAIKVAGFIYQKDFPKACASIKAEQAKLGMSYECDAAVEDPKADPWVATYVIFTGAAVLQKHLAAYTTTSLAATREADAMTPEELKKLNDSIAALSASVASIAGEVKELKAKGLSATGPVTDRVKPHADALRSCAAAMEAAGIGGHPEHGHVKVLRQMADHMEAEAAMHRVPHIYRDHGYIGAAAAAAPPPVDVKPLEQKLEAITTSLASVTTIVTDLQKKAFNAAAAPERRTISPEIRAFLDKHQLSAAADEGKLTVEQVDKALEGLPREQRMAQKVKLINAGALPAAGTAAA